MSSTFISPYFFPQAFSILSDVRDDEVRKRTSLLSLLTEVEGLLNKLDSDQFRVHHIEHHKLQLTRKEYFVLVAGKQERTTLRD